MYIFEFNFKNFNMKKIIILSITTLILASCGLIITKPIANSQIKKNKSKILPPDFFNKEYTLLILLDPETVTGAHLYNKKITKKLPKIYHGKYQIITMEEYKKLPNDASQFKYVFTHTETTVDDYGPMEKTTTRRFYLQDIKDGKKYICTSGGSFYMRVFEAYFNNLEKWRLEAE